jgi:predicted O-methyltransferase YrrM
MVVAADRTHHVIDGVPAYDVRFDEVLGFHEPGLAAVRLGGEGWHVGPDGHAAHRRRFWRTFGFYQGLAAVQGRDGWFHVLPDGSEAYAARYGWCGNFQDGRCAVRDDEGRYRHIDRSGDAAYGACWRYAGDFRDGLAVVQAADGCSTHIDLDGHVVHGRWFLDLDVFHKGLARARDVDGWMHIDRSGRPAYGRRFAAVEPFYNGWARVERFDGGLEVIDEEGVAAVELRPARRSEFAELSRDLVGFWRTQTIAAAVGLEVFEALPGSTEEVAARCGVSADRLARLLRALAELRLVETADARWRLTRRGAYLRRDDPLTLADAALEYAGRLGRSWERLPDALRGSHGWRPPDVFAAVARDPDRGAAHHRMLRSYARHDYRVVPAALGLRGDERIIDAGGGVGVLAERLLLAHPALRVVLIDRPEVAAQVEVDPSVRGRLEVVAADLLGPWNVAGDAVVFARVLHDWDDERAVTLLRRAHEALPPGGRLFVIEMLLPEAGGGGGLCDLHLLAVSGGTERTETAYRRLLERSGFDPDRVVRTAALPSVVVGVRR